MYEKRRIGEIQKNNLDSFHIIKKEVNNMNVKVIDFDSNFAVCNYIDLDGYNAYGYLHSYEVNDLKIPINEKVKIGDEFEADVMYESRGDIMLTVKSMYGRTFDDRLDGLSKYDCIKAKVIKLTTHGAIANVNGIPGFLRGNYEIGDYILASIGKIDYEKNMMLLNLESVIC